MPGIPDQYNNPKNIEAHYHTTGPEIWETGRRADDYLVAGTGTGGTLSGAGKYLKERDRISSGLPGRSRRFGFYEYSKPGTFPRPHVYQVEGIGEDHL